MPDDVAHALRAFGSTKEGRRVVEWMREQVYRICPPGLEDGAWRDFEAERRVYAKIAALMQENPSRDRKNPVQTRRTDAT